MLPERTTYQAQILGLDEPLTGQYNGSKDDFISVQGSQAGFAGETNEENTYKFTVENQDAAAAHEVDLILPVGGDDTNANVFIEGISSDYRYFSYGVMANPVRVIAFKVESDTASVLTDLKLEVSRYHPSKGFVVEKNIFPSNYRSAKDFQNGIINVPVGFQLDSRTKLSCIVPKGSSMTVTYLLGASLSLGEALRSKALRAGANV
jgi:hypothetical protein